MKTLNLQIDCGETTCVNLQTKGRCQFLGSVRFGSTPVCLLFRDWSQIGYSEKALKENKDGCLLRCSECLKTAVNNVV